MDITLKNLQTKIPILPTRIKKLVLQTFRHLRVSRAELSVVFVTPQRMKSLNARHLSHNYTTDILTFDYRLSPKTKEIQAEIIICPAVAAQNAATYDTTTSAEIELYLVHGILHLLGYDDHSPKDITRMRKKEAEIVSFLRKKP
ncbi:MAG: rRNA maturation RNase YbeY [Candidatus Omnitrophica bacterium]|nr:rRNA maturation RNase YbeY [Candidatus Omnitrophota bacterium]